MPTSSTASSCCAGSSSWRSFCAPRIASSRSPPSESSRAARLAVNTTRVDLLLRPKRLRTLSGMDYFGRAQFRTCLWPCVGRWASGQEAGQPPKEETTTSLHPRPAAGGETGNASSPLATRLKATTEGLFWLLPARMPGTLKRLVLLCQQCGTGSPLSGPRQQSRRRQSFRNRAELLVSQEVHLGGYAASRIRELG